MTVEILYRIKTGHVSQDGRPIYTSFIRGVIPKLQEKMTLPSGTILKFEDKGKLWEEYHVWKSAMDNNNIPITQRPQISLSEDEALKVYRRKLSKYVMDTQLEAARARRKKNKNNKRSGRNRRKRK